IRLLDERVSGVFSVDLKENASGVPCVTEINAGRFSSATNIFDLVGEHNMVSTFVRLARGESIKLRDPYDAVVDWYMLRDIDAPPRIFHASEFFDNVRDTWPAIDSTPGPIPKAKRDENHGESHHQPASDQGKASHQNLGHAQISRDARAAAPVSRGGKRD